MPTNVTILVTNSSTNAPVQNARVFVDGSASFDGQSNITTDSSGGANFTLTVSGSRLVQITADGLNSDQFPVTVDSTSATFSQNIALPPNQNLSSPFTLQFYPIVAGITWQLKSGAFEVTNGVSQSDGTSASPASVTYGTYTINANLDGYLPLSQPLILTGQTSPYVLTMIEDTDDESEPTGGTTDSNPSTSQPASILSQTTVLPPITSEYVYPNSDYDKYFTITGARIYIGSLFIDELNSISYALQDNAVPVYGYASRYIDAYAQGRSLVQGQFGINFVTEGYLYTVLREYSNIINGNQTTQALINDPAAGTVIQILGLMTTRDSLNQQANNNPNSSQLATINGSSTTQQAIDINNQIQALLAALTPQQVATLNGLRQKTLTTFTGPISFDNPIYQDVIFDIRVELGNEYTGVKRVRYLEKCKLISNEQVLDQSGQVIMDSYGFIARRLR